MTETPDVETVTPIYTAMLWRAENLLLSGAKLDAADMLTTAAETMRRFEHPAATSIASWARDLLILSESRHSGA